MRPKREPSVVNFSKSLLLALWYAFRYLLTLGWLRQALELVRGLVAIRRRRKRLSDHRRGRDPRCSPPCGRLTPDVYKRPDPLIYSQFYLAEQGLAVTWDNPDIQLFREGIVVSSSDLEADTDYEVRATIWNNSTDAPAVGMKVDFVYHDFGIGPVPIVIGSDIVTLPVKGAPGHPATASATWHTPARPGHYCLKVRLNWADDANPKNNLGQENTNVGTASSPAVFRFPVRNDATVRRTLRLAADAYVPPPPLRCGDRPKKEDSERKNPELVTRAVHVPSTEREADWTHARARHGETAYRIPTGWSVDLTPETLTLDAGQQREVTVTVTPPDDFRAQQAINVNALHGTELVGGVTLHVRATGEGG